MHLEQQAIPAGHGRAFRMRAGQLARIENTYGNQVVDAWAVASDDALEVSSMDHTRSVNSNIFFTEGMTVQSTRRQPMLTMLKDSAGLRHDTLLCPCSSELYQQLGCTDYHRSCTDNFHEALGAAGLSLGFTPASLNLFMNVPVKPDGTVERVPPQSAAGDHVLLRADMDLVLVLSACPQDITPINGADRKPTDVSVSILDALPVGASS